MYQTEVMPDLDKLTRSIAQTVQEVPSHVSKPEVNHGGLVMASIHNVTLLHPSEVLIDLKVCLIYIIKSVIFFLIFDENTVEQYIHYFVDDIGS